MDLSPTLIERLPDTYRLLQTANLTVHRSVARVVLHGSRGLAGGARPDSDVDLSLIVDTPTRAEPDGIEADLNAVFVSTFSAWRADVEVDLAVVFETRGCGLHCFAQTQWCAVHCAIGGRDCFGLYKVQKGFTGLVVDAGIEVRRMFPCLEIWRRISHNSPI
ncbi:MAG TPA: nucleotidyltransferase domain-containing protein [Anaerolineales bacterium]|nr:nucleotidyltransferase domain-containing protein [Anaerolineales bacterium]